MHPFQVLLRPIVTEKSTQLQEQEKYIFEVASKANKVMVRQAVQKAYGVKVKSVNMLKTPGKTKRYGPRLVKRPAVKKAIVTLKSGDRIQLFEGA
ncbi:MAG: 50S ribosomal protein L23 [Chloroflexi bacterium]|nr:50S ribosomal protein L23 [Chloroflexota bacterium]